MGRSHNLTKLVRYDRKTRCLDKTAKKVIEVKITDVPIDQVPLDVAMDIYDSWKKAGGF
jgi:hypothetical protein